VVCIKDESGECKETKPISDVDVELPASDEQPADELPSD
jgi:hypothetical protein